MSKQNHCFACGRFMRKDRWWISRCERCTMISYKSREYERERMMDPEVSALRIVDLFTKWGLRRE